MLNVYKNLEELLEGTANFVVACAQESIRLNGKFSLVLSGGSSPKKLHELLTTDRFRKQVDWKNVYFFFGDERYVPADHPDSNYLMAKQTLFDPLQISPAQVFRMDTSLTSAEAAKAYEKTIADYFTGKPEHFDLIILGLGDDAHTASLFPGTSVLNDEHVGVASLYIAKVKMDRITLTAPLINNGRNVAFLVYGEGKANAVRQILEGERNPTLYPGQLIAPSKGKLYWFMDESAAKRIQH